MQDKKLPLLLSFFLMGWGAAFSSPVLAQAKPQTLAKPKALEWAPKAVASITAKDLKKHLYYLADDKMEGRLTGTPGQIRAAEYFADHFRSLGLKPMGDLIRGKRHSFYQGYPVTLEKVHPKTGVYLGGKALSRHGYWSLPKPKGKLLRKVQGKLVFVGKGMRSDFQGVDLDGKIAVLYMHQKQVKGGVMKAFSEGFRLLASVRGRAKLSAQAGARGAIILTNKMSTAFLSATNMMGFFPGKPKVSRRGWGGRGMRMFGNRGGSKIPVVVLGGKEAQGVAQLLGLKVDELDSLDREGLGSLVGEESKKQVTIRYARMKEEAKALNVCAYLPGRDPKLKKEALIFSCHMDHLGMAADGSVFNGADDNGSGSSTVLEIAEAFARLPKEQRPRRSVIFLAVSGEELGLWGSEWYSEHPTWPLKKIVADINMDMLGRSTDKVPSNAIAVTPTWRMGAYSTLGRMAAEFGEVLGLEMRNGDRFYRRSDHYNFAKKGIPVVFFCDDEHPDYHMPSDTPDKIEYDKLARVARLAFLIGYRTADQIEPPRVLGSGDGWFPKKD
ncbi:MAG TPA: M28 family peptidase [Planctomycetes bacterium]|nr:M28 family peptidase [Planctomycetota bacterium]